MAQLDLSVDPQAEYEKKCGSAEDAVALVRSGDFVWIPSGHTPPALLALLATREGELRDVTIRSPIIPNMGWFREDVWDSFRIQIQVPLLPDNRQAIADRVVDYHPLHMIRQHKAQDTGREEAQPVDVLMIVVSPPNERGFVCVGHAAWDAVSSVDRADRVIAEVSPNTALTCGDSWIHISQIDALVLGDRPLLAGPDPDPADFPEVDRRITENIKPLIRDGDTIQLGLGKHTAALTMLGAFDERNDLGYWGELTVPGTVALARKGVITGRRAEVIPKHFVACHIGNSPDDLEYIAGNPFFQLRSYELTNDPLTIARHDHMTTINGALTIDLSGQIGVHAVGPQIFSGLGGQLAFHLGAFMSKAGRAITVIPSTTREGVSTIVPQFDAGQIVAIPRELADTVVTDHGVAKLLNLSVRERADALIAAAHPDHRDHLQKAAHRLYYP